MDSGSCLLTFRRPPWTRLKAGYQRSTALPHFPQGTLDRRRVGRPLRLPQSPYVLTGFAEDLFLLLVYRNGVSLPFAVIVGRVESPAGVRFRNLRQRTGWSRIRNAGFLCRTVSTPVADLL